MTEQLEKGFKERVESLRLYHQGVMAREPFPEEMCVILEMHIEMLMLFLKVLKALPAAKEEQ